MNLTAYRKLVSLWQRVECVSWKWDGPKRERIEKAFLAWWNTKGWQRHGRIVKREPDVKSGEPVPVYYAGLDCPIQQKVR